MKNLSITVPYPLSVNKTYYNRSIKKDINNQNNLRGRGLTRGGKDYKMLVAWMLRGKFPDVKFGKESVKVTIIDNPSHLNRDNHNGLKILFDSIELSGIIENDKQIIACEIIPGIIKNPPSWTFRIEPYQRLKEDIQL